MRGLGSEHGSDVRARTLVLVALALLMRLLMAASEIRVPELALASLRGVSSRRLWVLEENLPARAFYERITWEFYEGLV